MKIILKNVRVSFLNVFEPRGFNGQAPKYGCQIIMPADHPQMPELLSAVLTAAKEKFPNKVKGDKFPMALKNPIRDGAERAEDYPEYAGQVFFNVTASEKRKPVVLRPARDAEGKLITQTRDDGSKVPVLEKIGRAHV